MKADIHPAYHQIKVKCSCGHEFETGSSLKDDSLTVEVCSNCHPYYTGKQKVIDTAGRVKNFEDRYKNVGQKKPAAPAASTGDKTAKKGKK